MLYNWFVFVTTPEGKTIVTKYDNFNKLLDDISVYIDNTDLVVELPDTSINIIDLGTNSDNFSVLVIKGMLELGIKNENH